MEENSQIELLIAKRLMDVISPEEERILNDLISESPDNRKYVESVENIWKHSGKSSLFHSVDPDKDWQNVRKRMGFGKKQVILTRRRFTRIAAVLIPALFILISLIAYLFIPGFGRLTAYSAKKNIEHINLPDGSHVTLKKGSKLIVVKGLNRGGRKVKLKGEAYFEVKKDPGNPFLISVAGTVVEVVGTEFCISANSKKVTVYVSQGVVRFSGRDQEILVHKGEKAVFEGRSIHRSEIKNNNYLAWKNGIMTFNDAGMKEILDVIVDTYDEVSGYKINTKSDVKVTTAFDHQPLKEVIEELRIHFNKKIVLHDGILVISD